MYASLVSQGIHSEYFVVGIRNKIFNSGTIAALRRALGDEESWPCRENMVDFVTAAIAQGMLYCFPRIFILKYFQREIRTIYLILRPFLHWDLH